VALIEQAEVERLFRALVQQLAERDPARLSAPFQVAELYQQIIPYRANRARLGFDTNQDYETAVLGLLAGLGGYADLEPVEARDFLAAEATSPNPDPGAFHEFAGARVRLSPGRVREVLDAQRAFAPPTPVAPATSPEAASSAPSPAATPEPPQPQPAPPGSPFALEPDAARAAAAPPPTSSPAPDRTPCHQCGRPLPTDRTVVFCPYCGTAVGTVLCARCGDELQPDWRFCPRCGHASGV
jgi:RNA polymerase subunit RPABC4/transcription elongation factor Spt4